ncbi:response regulator [Desulforegula conservatrix]|uniref:response regulator n=1 Tax=Desulforegula conservatrix TaxID=153026 RepID=UPI00042289F3|nr:response regulator [Desulforegula conservatrix]
MTLKILIVDDSGPMRAVIIKTVKAAGFGCAVFLEAKDGQDALNILEREEVDLIMTDYNMPLMNGLELVDRVKHDEKLKSIPVVAVTTDGNPRRIIEFIEKGAADYVRKPFTPEVISEKLKRILGDVNGRSNDPAECNEDFDF